MTDPLNNSKTGVGLEEAVFRIGKALEARSAGLAPSLFDSRWWSNSLLDWCMKNDAFKVQLFRFIDVLPSLPSDDQVARLADEYFSGLRDVGGPWQWGLQAATATKLGARLGARALRKRITQMARTFIAGNTIEDALPVLAGLWKEGRGFSVDLLGEATVSEREADSYRDRCLDALARLSRAAAAWPSNETLLRDHLGPLPRVNLSIKLSALYSQLDAIDPEGSYAAVAARLRPIMDLAVRLPAGITFDMEQAELKDLTLLIFRRLLTEEPYCRYPYAGLALQAYLRDSARDLDELIAWVEQRGTPVAVRLVKGAYWDSDLIRYRQRGWPPPVFLNKWETDANYESLSRRLIAAARAVRPCFATHNLRSLAHAQALAESAGLPPEACEYQMIFGMAEPLQQAVVAEGRRLRLYVPVGEFIPGMAYLVRRLLENTSNESFLRKEYVEGEALERLLAAPAPPATASQSIPASQPAPGTAPSFTNEPHCDFSKEAVRAAMLQALGKVRSELGGDLEPLSGFTPPASGSQLVSRNPARPEEVICRLPGLTPADLLPALGLARERLPAWREKAPEDRAQVLMRAADILRRRRMELAAWEILETGKPWREADADVAEAIDFLRFYAAEMLRLATPRRLGQEPGEDNRLLYAPRGVAAVIAPWNFPLAIPTGMVSAALVTGNTVLFKPSERALRVARLLVEAFAEAGLPPGVLQYLPGGPEVGRQLVASPEVNLIAFTGSKDVGLGILSETVRRAGERRDVTHVIAEMGGKNAIIVDETADLDEAVTGVVASFAGYQGQKCSACSRAIVLDAVYEPFLQRLSEAVLSLRIGDPADPGSRLGPMIDARACGKVKDYVEIGKRDSRPLVLRDAPGGGHFAGPAVFADVPPASPLAQEEIFGPVLAVLRAKTFAEAVALANDSAYALTGGVYSRSPVNIQAAREAFDVGNLYINRPITGALVNRQPFGGHRLSGVGVKAGGRGYLEQFMVARVISENTLRRGFAPAETE